MSDTPTRLADFLPYKLSITSNAVSDLIASEYKSRFGLKVSEWRIMAVLGDTGDATQRELVEATRMDKVAVNRATKVLVGRSLVQRNPNDQDGRSHHLVLTDTGRKLHREIMPLALQMEESILSVLGPRQVEQLASLLEKVLERTDALAGDE